MVETERNERLLVMMMSDKIMSGTILIMMDELKERQ